MKYAPEPAHCVCQSWPICSGRHLCWKTSSEQIGCPLPMQCSRNQPGFFHSNHHDAAVTLPSLLHTTFSQRGQLITDLAVGVYTMFPKALDCVGWIVTQRDMYVRLYTCCRCVEGRLYLEGLYRAAGCREGAQCVLTHTATAEGAQVRALTVLVQDEAQAHPVHQTLCICDVESCKLSYS